MKVYQTNEIKNIALLGSAGSGKTTLAESMVYEAGIIKRRGTVEGKNTMSDYFPVEQEYGYSVFSTVFHVEWNNKKLNIIDCPGSDDFVGEGGALQGNTDEILLSVFDALVDCIVDFNGLAQTNAHVTVAVADNHQSGELEFPAALNGLGNTGEANHFFGGQGQGGRINSFIHNFCYPP